MRESFSYFETGITQVTPSKDISIQEVAKLIQSPSLKKVTEDMRSDPDLVAKDKKKKKLPYVTFSGSFTRRAVGSIKDRSEYFCVDFDHIGSIADISRIEKKLSDTYTPALSFISPSGDGLKVIFKIDPAAGSHSEFFNAIKHFIKTETGKNIDEACKDVSRACFLCHDPEAMTYTPKVLNRDFIEKYTPGKEEKIFHEVLTASKLPFSNGNRNLFIAELAGGCHRRGVSESFCFEKCLDYQEEGFSENEIRTIVKSIYGNPAFDPKSPGMAELESRLMVDLTKEPEAAPAILYYKDIPMACLQDFTLITGKAKVKKTFLSVYLVAAYLGYRNDLIFNDPLRQGTVLWFDTEQSPHYFYKTLNRVCRMIRESNPQRLKGYNLKTLTPGQKSDFIEHVINNTPDVQLVVIDGIRDLVFDINSPEEATKTSVRLMKWCAEQDLHIICILHQNKGDGNARGHLGTELVNKAQTVLSVSLEAGNKTVSSVDPEYTRDLDFPGFSFMVNDDSLPELCDTPQKEPEGKKIPTPNLLADETHFEVLRAIYKRIKEYPTYDELTDLIIEGFNFSFGRSNCRQYISYYQTKEWITKQRAGHKMLYKYEKVVN